MIRDAQADRAATHTTTVSLSVGGGSAAQAWVRFSRLAGTVIGTSLAARLARWGVNQLLRDARVGGARAGHLRIARPRAGWLAQPDPDPDPDPDPAAPSAVTPP